MFEIGFVEILMISALALIVLGPEKLPKVARQVGRWVGRARSMARQFREQLEEEVTVSDTPARKSPPPTGPTKPPPSAANTPAAAPAAAPTPAEPAASESAAPAAQQSAEDDPANWYPPDHHAHPDQLAAATEQATRSDAPQVDWVDDAPTKQRRTDPKP